MLQMLILIARDVKTLQFRVLVLCRGQMHRLSLRVRSENVGRGS